MTCQECGTPIGDQRASVQGREVCWPCSYKLLNAMFRDPPKSHVAAGERAIKGIMKQRKFLTGLDCLPGQLGMFDGA